MPLELPNRLWRPRFSLKVVLLIFTVVACWLSWRVHEARERLQLLSRLEHEKVSGLAVVTYYETRRDPRPFRFWYYGAIPKHIGQEVAQPFEAYRDVYVPVESVRESFRPSLMRCCLDEPIVDAIYLDDAEWASEYQAAFPEALISVLDAASTGSELHR